MSPDLTALVQAVLDDVDFAANPYFAALEDGSLTREELIETQLQFHAAVAHFARPLAQLAARIENAELRGRVLRNAWDEHGDGDPSRTHDATFVALLTRLMGADARMELARRATWPEVQAFNALLSGIVDDDPLAGAAALGIVEHIFAGASGRIGRAIVARGFVTAEAMIHYDLHERLDVAHAADLFAVCAASFDDGPRARANILRGLRVGAYAFDRLYADLHRRRGRRWPLR